MIIYLLKYYSGESDIKIEKIKCKETANSYCWDGRRLPKFKVNVVEIYAGNSWDQCTAKAQAYAVSLDFLTEFKYKVAKKVEKVAIVAEKNLNNMKQFLDENKPLLEKYCDKDFVDDEFFDLDDLN